MKIRIRPTFLIFLIIGSFALYLTDISAESSIRKVRGTSIVSKSHNRIRVPRDYRLLKAERIRTKSEGIIVDLYSRRFSQGDALYVEIRNDKNHAGKRLIIHRITFGKKGILFSEKDWGFRCIIGISPLVKPGKIPLRITFARKRKAAVFTVLVPVVRSLFKYYKRPLDLGKYSNLDYQEKPEIIAFIKRCTAKKKKAFSRVSRDMLGAFMSHPRNMHYITSPFWAKRTIMQYRYRRGKRIRYKNRLNTHRGLDFRGKTGDPVYALADGRIALAEELYYEGNFIIVDHGNSIFSYFMHLHRLKVRKGDRVRAGDLIGLVGSSGISTASHLHVSLMIQGVQVDPLSLLSLPIRE